MNAYWIFFAVYCLCHLSACFLEKEAARKITKVFIVPLLLLGLFLGKAGDLLVISGLVLCWIGDILLLFTGKKRYLAIGGSFFLAGHFCYIAAMARLFFASNSLGDLPAWFWLGWAGAAGVLLVIAAWKVSRHIGPIAYLGAVYFSVLLAALLLSIAAGKYTLTAAFSIFLLSDVTLSYCRLVRQVRRSHFYIMSTYILAQALICASFL